MTHPSITVAIPTLPVRGQLLRRAVQSVARQTQPAAAISIATDVSGAGAAATRQRALDAVQTEWVALLDDDDAFKEAHLELLYGHAMAVGADYVYSWFDMIGGVDPFPDRHRNEDFDVTDPTETTTTILVRTELAKSIGYKPLDRGEANSGEDFGFTLGCVAAGAKISHLIGVKTWYYHVHHGNTSGLATKGDAKLWTPTIA
jgi:glycosyltransferase involved in cell wall biosynthesis